MSTQDVTATFAEREEMLERIRVASREATLAREAYEASRRDFADLLRAGQAAPFGLTMREMGAAAGVSHQRVHEVINLKP